jgi:Pyruvate/2-oxoacid:ferredoxin oxidoreductase delta subunit
LGLFGNNRKVLLKYCMCEFCTKHGDGKVWYKNASNYAGDLLSDIKRRNYIRDFLNSTIGENFRNLGRLEAIYRKRGRLPDNVVKAIEEKARAEHFGQVLPIEEIRDIVFKAKSIVRMPCACRWTVTRKEERCCYAMSYCPETWYREFDMSYFGKLPDEGLETVSAEEAMQQMEVFEGGGAIHSIWTMMTPFIGAVCNCTAADCIAMRTLVGVGGHIMARAEHVALIDNHLCMGCGLCLASCQFGAINSVTIEGRQVAVIAAEKCYGCGLCRRACGKDAISLVSRQYGRS